MSPRRERGGWDAMREKDIRRNVRESYGEAIDRRVAGQGSAIDAVTDMTRGN